MRLLEEILKDPQASTISEILVCAADPFRQFSAIPAEIFEEMVHALNRKFEEGRTLVNLFRHDLEAIDGHNAGFKAYAPETVYDKLAIAMGTRPDEMVTRLIWLWRHRTQIDQRKLDELDKSLLRIVPYTHQWRSKVEKSARMTSSTKMRIIETPFDHLKRIRDPGITLYLRARPGRGYPDYALYGWQEKEKVIGRVVAKLLYKIFEAMERSKDDKYAFFAEDFGTDYFGDKPLGLTWDIRKHIDWLGYRSGRWSVVNKYPDRVRREFGLKDGQPEFYSVTKRKPLNVWEYMLMAAPHILPTTERLQLQVTTFPYFLNDDLFDENSHPLNRVRRDALLVDFQSRYPEEYGRMYQGMMQLLSQVKK